MCSWVVCIVVCGGVFVEVKVEEINAWKVLKCTEGRKKLKKVNGEGEKVKNCYGKSNAYGECREC